MEKIKLDQLTGLRYFAALLVFLSHLSWGGSSLYLVNIFESGYVGVSFFFLLSGFVLSYSYKQKILDRSLSFIKYFLLRLARLSPLHFLTALPFFLYALYKLDLSFFKLVLNLFYLQSWVPSSTYYFSFNSPSWSLSNEMFFYICFFPLIFIRVKTLLKFFILLFVIIFFSASLVELLYSEKVFFGSSTLAHWLFYIFPGFRLLEFIVGMLLFKLWESGFRLPSWVTFPSYVLLFLSMYFAKEVPEPFRMSLFFLPFIVLFFYVHLTESGLVVRFFSTKTMVLLGNSSFAFYLIHQPLIVVLKKIVVKFELSNFSFFVFSCLVISFLSIAIYVLYERRAEFYLKLLIKEKVN
ncbi:acyltransferase family protein [Pectobacterium polaris]|uniref:Acyltransferase n=1 Tax=Pectobacterium polaris TaxID=2042057 RepID=A0AAW5G9U3_9GAMM|nr:acyltransferase [Pectobacterium polaris]MCL6350491.1 acyltransferase [Pectobacterium polaris]MCL6367585.1 acyltransferase [Pectobacterium polaris]